MDLPRVRQGLRSPRGACAPRHGSGLPIAPTTARQGLRRQGGRSRPARSFVKGVSKKPSECAPVRVTQRLGAVWACTCTACRREPPVPMLVSERSRVIVPLSHNGSIERTPWAGVTGPTGTIGLAGAASQAARRGLRRALASGSLSERVSSAEVGPALGPRPAQAAPSGWRRARCRAGAAADAPGRWVRSGAVAQGHVAMVVRTE